MNQVKKLKGAGVMLLVSKKLNPKVRHDLHNMHKKYDSIWVEFKAGLNKNDRTTLLNLAYNPNRNNKIDFLEDLAKSNSFFKKSVIIWNKLTDDKVNFKDILTYRKAKIKFKNYFLLLFKEDPSVATHCKVSWKSFKFI